MTTDTQHTTQKGETMKQSTQRENMPSFRIGKMVQYANWNEPRFEPAHQVGFDAFFDQFSDMYWTKREDA